MMGILTHNEVQVRSYHTGLAALCTSSSTVLQLSLSRGRGRDNI